MVWLLRIYLLWVGWCVCFCVLMASRRRWMVYYRFAWIGVVSMWACVRLGVFTTNGHHMRCRPMGLSMKGVEQRMFCRLVLTQLVLIQWFCALESRLGWQRRHVHGQHWLSMPIHPLGRSIHMNQHERLEYWIKGRKLCVHRKKKKQTNEYQNRFNCTEDECKMEYSRCETTSGAGWTILVWTGAASKVGASKLGLAAANAKKADKTI